MDEKSIFIIILLILLPLIVFSSFASPSMELVREGNINVTSDTQGVIELQPSNQYDIVDINENNVLSISPENMGSDSINSNMQLFIGDISNPQSDPAFTIGNLATESISATINIQPKASYTGDNDDVQYIIQTDSGIESIAVDESVTIPMQSGERIYSSVIINSSESGNIDVNIKITGEKI